MNVRLLLTLVLVAGTALPLAAQDDDNRDEFPGSIAFTLSRPFYRIGETIELRMEDSTGSRKPLRIEINIQITRGPVPVIDETRKMTVPVDRESTSILWKLRERGGALPKAGMYMLSLEYGGIEGTKDLMGERTFLFEIVPNSTGNLIVRTTRTEYATDDEPTPKFYVLNKSRDLKVSTPNSRPWVILHEERPARNAPAKFAFFFRPKSEATKLPILPNGGRALWKWDFEEQWDAKAEAGNYRVDLTLLVGSAAKRTAYSRTFRLVSEDGDE